MSRAHAANVVHRDLKPENLFLVERGPDQYPTLKVLDFGVAKVVRETTTMGGTKPGLGTPLWAAPEQANEGQAIRPSSDVWSLGLITYRLLAGKLYWKCASKPKTDVFEMAVEMLRAPLEKASVRSREIGAVDMGAEFDAWFERAVTRDPKARFASAREAAEALFPIIDPIAGASIFPPAPTPSAPQTASSPASLAATPTGSRTKLFVIAAVVLVVVVVGAALGITRFR
jgi:serine/threonine-protein kinase